MDPVQGVQMVIEVVFTHFSKSYRESKFNKGAISLVVAPQGYGSNRISRC